MAQPNSSAGRILTLARLLVGALVVVAIVATFAETASRAAINPFNFFGYFTIQSNTLFALAALISGTWGLAHPGPQPAWLTGLRALVTVCMIIVGLVYAVLLAPLGLAGGVPVPWANWVMHILGPVLALGDWALTRDRVALPARAALILLAYPVVWTTVVLIRGATDGWVPYPFLDPAQGYGAVALTVLIIAVVFLAVSAAVVWWSRVAVGGDRRAIRR